MVVDMSKPAAAFGRLCVETAIESFEMTLIGAAAFGRLCVETSVLNAPSNLGKQPPSGGCVLKQPQLSSPPIIQCSHLRVAVC